MSSKPPTAFGKLIAQAGPGVTIHIFDGLDREIASGFAKVMLDAPLGLYRIEWLSAGQVSQSFVRLLDSDEPIVVGPDNLSDPSSTAQSPWPRPDLVAFAGDELRPSERSYGSSIAIVVAADPGVSASEATEDLRLLNSREKAMRASSKVVPQLSAKDGETVRSYRVRPGRYRMQFRSITGETLVQSVPALPGRQTIIFLSAGQTDLLVAEGDTFARIKSCGIEASRTVMISVAGDEEDARIRERVRLAGVLLHDLAAGQGSLSRQFVSVLDDARTDPLLKLLGGLVALSRLEQAASPALDEPWPSERQRQSAFRDHWEQLAAKWIGDPTIPGLPPDATAAWWHLTATPRSFPKKQLPEKVPGRIEVPPMLECAWRWAIAHSVDEPRAVSGTTSLLAAARSGGGGTPWLCWKSSAAKAASVAPRSGGSDLDQLVEDIARKTGTLTNVEGDSRVSANWDETLSPDLSTTALRVSQVAGSTSSGDPASVSTKLALSLALPAQQLKRRLVRTNEALDAAIEERDASRPARSIRSDGAAMSPQFAPGLSRRITVPDDPHKGRFGGRSARADFKSSATFTPKSSDWTKITITVNGNAPDGAIAEFYMHDSFRPSTYEANFKNGRAEVSVGAWGGFTVGIWIPDRGVELELDLAKQPRAPHNIRTR